MKMALSVFIIVLLALPAGEAQDSAASPPIAVRGRWLHDAGGQPTPPGSFTRGLQPSGLAFRKGELWCAGDQRSAYPGHLLRIDPGTARLIGAPVRLELPPSAAGENPAFEEYRRIPNSDLEGLAVDPRDPDTFFAVTEDKIPWLAEIHLEWSAPAELTPQGNPRSNPHARIVELTPIALPAGLASWRDDPNFRWEGCAVSESGETLYLAFERAKDDLPRIYELPLKSARSGKAASLKELAIHFADVPRRPDKASALLNLNDIQFLNRQGRPYLLAVARDQERVLVVDLEKGNVTRVVDLDLRDPAGNAIEWVSPEGLAIDAATDRIWLINDPDSVRGNYRARSEPGATGEFADYSPLLFDVRLSAILGSAPPAEKP